MKNIFVLQGLDLLSIEQIQKEQFKNYAIDVKFPNILQKRDGKNISAKEVTDLCNSPILGSNHFVVVVENYSKCFKKKNDIEELIKKCPSDCLLFLVELYNPEKKKDIFTLIKNNQSIFSSHQRIEVFSIGKTNPYIKKYLKQKIDEEGLTIDQDALSHLLEKYSEHYSLLYGEVDKIISYCFDKKKITLEDVSQLTISQDKDIFQIINAIWNKNKKFYMENINRFVKKENLVGLIYLFQNDIKRKITSYNNSNYSSEELAKKLLMLFHIEKILFSENIVNPSKEASQVNVKALSYFHRFVFSF